MIVFAVVVVVLFAGLALAYAIAPHDGRDERRRRRAWHAEREAFKRMGRH